MANDKDLAALVAAQNEQIETLKALIQDQGDQIAALSGETEKPVEEEKIETPKDTFKVDGNTYKFTVPRYIKPIVGLVLARDALKDPAELERLVTIKSGVVTKASRQRK